LGRNNKPKLLMLRDSGGSEDLNGGVYSDGLRNVYN
jgi:hypothetical protein